jgi:signal transduction histidine kinase/CheY-like chemotaxis protein
MTETIGAGDQSQGGGAASLAVVALAYFGVCSLTFSLSMADDAWRALWPAGVVALAAGLRARRPRWARILPTLLASGLAAGLLAGRAFLPSLGTAAVGALGPCACAWAIIRWGGPWGRVGRLPELLLLAAAVLLASAAAAVLLYLSLQEPAWTLEPGAPLAPLAWTIAAQAGLGLAAAAAHLVSLTFADLKAAAQSAKDDLHRLSTLVNRVPKAVIYRVIREHDHRVVFEYVSEQVRAVNGLEPEAVLRDSSLFYGQILKEDLPALAAARERSAREAGVQEAEFRIRRPDGGIALIRLLSTAHVLPDGRLCWDGLQMDVTDSQGRQQEMIEQQARLAQTQKMELIGRLAGGVAHDFNNMLGIIMGYAELALAEAGTGREVQAHLKGIQKAAGKSGDLTRQLLAFARKQDVAPKVIDLNAAVGSMLAMLGRLIGERVEVEWRPAEGLWPVKVDPTQIDQILANLCVNSRDAIAGVGKVSISTRNVEAPAASRAGRSGAFVVLEVADDGRGMDAATLEHIFEPFFTTKETGQGVGLGLALVHGIVEQNHGFIEVRSAPGQGTAFAIHLPRQAAAAAPEELAVAPAEPAMGSECVLVVEDEPELLKLCQVVLQRQGYQVLAAGSPLEAIRLAAAHPVPIHLLLSDVMMPGMDGRDLAAAMQAQYPQLKVLFMSGYTAGVFGHHSQAWEALAFLQKPFSIPVLTAKVRAVLDAGRAGAL